MSCNSCAKPYNLFRKEKGCPSCGFSFCSKCLDNKIYVEKLKANAKVCMKCAKTTNEPKVVEPPDAYYKRLGVYSNDTQNDNTCSQDQEIQTRLQKLKQDSTPKMTPEEEIATRLKNIKGEVPSASDAELKLRLANLRGVSVSSLESKNVFPIVPETRTEQEQADDLLKQYMEQAQIDGQYKDEFDALVSDMEARVQKLKSSNPATNVKNELAKETPSSEDEEELAKKIVEKIKVESSLEDDEITPKENDELPFCEICNEDAKVRCLGCHYLFCKRCFLDHKDDDDGCDRYEPYKPPKHL